MFFYSSLTKALLELLIDQEDVGTSRCSSIQVPCVQTFFGRLNVGMPVRLE